jgi:hypothetical protein
MPKKRKKVRNSKKSIRIKATNTALYRKNKDKVRRRRRKLAQVRTKRVDARIRGGSIGWPSRKKVIRNRLTNLMDGQKDVQDLGADPDINVLAEDVVDANDPLANDDRHWGDESSFEPLSDSSVEDHS